MWAGDCLTGKLRGACSAALTLLTVAALAVAASGCGGGSSNSSPTPAGPKPAISGFVRGGAAGGGSAISGAVVTVYQAGASGYGTGAVQLATTTSARNGSFSFKSIACQSGAWSQEIYLVATGGTAKGQDAANSAIALSAAIGACDNLPKKAVTINEATTVATVWALSQFADESGQDIGTSSTNETGLENSFAIIAAQDLVDVHTGLAPTSFPNGVQSPTPTLYTLANILSGCVNSNGPTSSACHEFFAAATPVGGSTPTTTLEAAVDIAHNPANNVDELFGLVPVDAPFAPDLSAAPDSWALELTYAGQGAGFNAPNSVTLDGAGNVWVANAGGDSVSELVAASGYTTGLNLAPVGAALNFPVSIAIDTANNVWVANFGGNSASELTAASNYATGLNFAPAGAAFDGPLWIALNAAGDLWAANYLGDSVSELTAASSHASGFNFAPAGAALSGPVAVDLDPAGNVWLVNYVGDSVSELTAGSSYATGLNFAPVGAGFAAPISIAIDMAGNVWAGNDEGDSVSELTAASSYTTGLNFAPAGAQFSEPDPIAFDGAGNLWVANYFGNSVSELTASSGYLTGYNFAPQTTFQGVFEIALDASGNVWTANNYDDSVSELIGIAAPVLTPAQACLFKGNNVCTP